mgnify:CR=1 FL=1
MQKIIVAFFALFLFGTTAHAQKYFTRDAKVKFSSDTPMEKIEAINKSGTCVLDAATGKMEWKVLIKGFLFEKALMQEHFNENYIESDKYPKAIFKGKINEKIDFTKNGTYDISATGDFTLHGVTKARTLKGKIAVNQANLSITTDFDVALADHKIEVPQIVFVKIAQIIKVKNKYTFAPYVAKK